MELLSEPFWGGAQTKTTQVYSGAHHAAKAAGLSPGAAKKAAANARDECHGMKRCQFDCHHLQWNLFLKANVIMSKVDLEGGAT